MASVEHKGTVSHGTTRYVDLIPTFWNYALEHIPGATITVGDADFYYNTVVPLAEGEPFTDSSMSDDEENIANLLLDRLLEILNDLAPEGYYFGAHPGDDGDYGFWPIRYRTRAPCHRHGAHPGDDSEPIRYRGYLGMKRGDDDA